MKKKHICLNCGCDMSHRHFTSKYCYDCAKIRSKEQADKRLKKKND